MCLYCRYYCRAYPLPGSSGSTDSSIFCQKKKRKVIHSYCKTEYHVRVHSRLRFIRLELLCELFSPQNYEKWVHNPLFNFPIHAIVDQIVSVNMPTIMGRISIVLTKCLFAVNIQLKLQLSTGDSEKLTS